MGWGRIGIARRAWCVPGKAAQCGLLGCSRLATGLGVTVCVALQLRRVSVSCSGRTRWPGHTWRHACSSGIVLASLRQEIPSVLPQGPVSRQQPDVYECGDGRCRWGTRCAGSGSVHAGPSCAQGAIHTACQLPGAPGSRGLGTSASPVGANGTLSRSPLGGLGGRVAPTGGGEAHAAFGSAQSRSLSPWARANPSPAAG